MSHFIRQVDDPHEEHGFSLGFLLQNAAAGSAVKVTFLYLGLLRILAPEAMLCTLVQVVVARNSFQQPCEVRPEELSHSRQLAEHPVKWIIFVLQCVCLQAAAQA
eukprot:CAMPEP_0178466734 /NCGR_PEP_ID=MMETSP0689_2-20121128/52055_1 /TAXON_ID=160604 /ORGANISM="Amphidinium massartii, Strain CS-259" /LENGTH=104 /DNA_ID=CAMNT_0020093765 /DNA_START=329 /DNA_END=643 /DNA_ORIENTATION=-